ncbi:MAG TPA: hypothetical protein H9693_04545 [Firmicutes bacterium]|nr:hypothetical protein [Bacillota bacterium]
MALTKKQAELDVSKWLKSEEAGHDLCGEFDFCAKCDKELENPCAKALDAYKKAAKEAKAPKAKAEKPAAKTAAKKRTAVKKQA